MQPAKEKIKSFCNQQSYDRGVRYLRQGRVEQLSLKRESVKSKVRGSQLYEVRLNLDEPDFDAICTCPYDWGGYCKHIVAVLLELSERDSFFDMARGYRGQDEPMEAATIYRAVAEVIAEGTEPIDNFSGYHGDEFELAINNYAESVVEAELGFQEKKEQIDYLLEKYNEKAPDYFEEYYVNALKTICTEEKHYRHWKKLMQPLLKDELASEIEGGLRENYETIQLVKSWIHILKNLEEEDELEELYEKIYRVKAELCLDYGNWLKDKGRGERAIEVVEECLKEFNRTSRVELRKLLVDLYESRNPEKYVVNLMKLYKDRPN
ncbi:SWIM zinc finger family protein [Candidatus Bipolaricaulota bacterium]|nr:SWIM zinc finger family protein [Candidatus Bipolaricaulota bacterium]